MAAPRFFTDKDGNVVVAQWPNPPLVGWLVFRAAALVFPDGAAHAGLSFLGQASLFTWAYLELVHGSSPFRRVLGGTVLGALVGSAFR